MNADQVSLEADARDTSALIGGRESITPLLVVSWDPEHVDDFARPTYPAPRWARPRRRVGAVLTAVGLLMAGSFLAGIVFYGLVWGGA